MKAGTHSLEDNDALFFNDLRFGTMDIEDPDSEFIFSYKLSQEHGELVATETEKEMTDAKNLLPRLWARILGN